MKQDLGTTLAYLGLIWQLQFFLFQQISLGILGKPFPTVNFTFQYKVTYDRISCTNSASSGNFNNNASSTTFLQINFTRLSKLNSIFVRFIHFFLLNKVFILVALLVRNYLITHVKFTSHRQILPEFSE